MTTRDELLNGVKRALAGRDAPAPKSAEPLESIRAEIERGREASGPQSPEALLERFRSELSGLSADVTTAGSADEAAESIARDLRAAGVERVALQPSPDLESIRETLAIDGLTVVPLDEGDGGERRALLAEVEAVVTAADHALATTGTLVFTPDTLPDRLAAGLTPWHIAVIRSSRLVRDLSALVQGNPTLARRSLLLVTGPSRTADIEKQIVLGAHGPKRLTVVVVGS
jgi:L-lactate dehydrogenase complex protein LldG